MLHQLTAAAVIIVLVSGTARAQVPGDSPNMNLGAAVSGSRGLGVVSGSRGPAGFSADHENERNYRETLKRIPDKKASNDPWKTIRPASTASPPDRHRVQ
jgi:hypothetical protein